MDVVTSSTRFLLELSMLKGVGPAALKKVAAIDGFADVPVEELAQVVPQIARALEAESSARWAAARNAATTQVKSAEKHRARILSPIDPDYPSLLAETKDDPFLLFVKGSLAKDPSSSVTIIGTREPTATGQVIAERVAQAFVKQGWSVVSGLALGCDGIAHRAALAHGGHTVAVLAHGLQMIAPSSHRALAQAILDAGGALVSEYLFGQGVQSQQFVKRDRTQAGMAQGVVMVQSDVKGGSLHASRAALDYGRWLAVPYPTAKDVQQGEPKVQANLVIADGSVQDRAALLRCPVSALERVLILRDRADILRLAGVEGELATSSVRPDLDLATIDERTEPHDLPTHQPDAEIAGVHHANEPSGSGEGGPGEVEGSDVTYEVFSLTDDPGHDSSDKSSDEEAIPQAEQTSVDKPSPPPRRARRYHVAVHDVVGNADLVISQVPSWLLAEYRDSGRATARDVDVFVDLSVRLEHLQERLDGVRKLQSSVTDKDRPRSLFVQLLVEDVLLHMKRSIDDLGRLSFGKAAHATVEVPAEVDQSQPSLLEGWESEPGLHIDLAMVVDQIVKSLPSSVVVPSGAPVRAAPARRNDAIDVPLVDLVRSFNGLLVRALDETSSHTVHSDGRAKQLG